MLTEAATSNFSVQRNSRYKYQVLDTFCSYRTNVIGGTFRFSFKTTFVQEDVTLLKIADTLKRFYGKQRYKCQREQYLNRNIFQMLRGTIYTALKLNMPTGLVI